MSPSPHDDRPFGVFRLGYNLFVLSMVIMMAVVLVWLVWKMFDLTPAGTSQAQLLTEVRPRQMTVAAQVSSRLDPCYVPPPEVAVCQACHVIGKAGNQVCPSLAEIGKVALERIADPAYTGTAKSAEAYIRESIVNPGVYVVASPPGKVYGSQGKSVMPVGLDQKVDMEAVVAYLVAANPDTQTCGKGTPTPGK